MKIIKLTQGKEAMVDDDLYDALSEDSWCYSNGYAIRGVGGRDDHRFLYMHKVILGWKLGLDPLDPSWRGDHKDLNKLNNLSENLRLSDKSKDSQNRPLQANN